MLSLPTIIIRMDSENEPFHSKKKKKTTAIYNSETAEALEAKVQPKENNCTEENLINK